MSKQQMIRFCEPFLCSINIICGDNAQTYQFDKHFDVAMIFNAFPHFMEPEKIIIATAKILNAVGVLLFLSRYGQTRIRPSSSKKASEISIPLLHQDDLIKLMSPYFNVDIVIANNDMFQVSGTKNNTILFNLIKKVLLTSMPQGHK